MTSKALSVDEIVSYLKHSSLPTVLVEGDDDLSVLRWMEDYLEQKATVLPCEGKDAVLNIFRRRAEIGRSDIVFFVDQDLWLYSGKPEEFSEVVTTEGYSIENDILASGVVERLLEVKEKEDFDNDLNLVCVWFANQVSKATSGESYTVDVHVARILSEIHVVTDASEPLFNLILAEYRKMLRGKTLLELLVKYLSAADRRSKYSKANVFEVSTKTLDPQGFPAIAQINDRLS